MGGRVEPFVSGFSNPSDSVHRSVSPASLPAHAHVKKPRWGRSLQHECGLTGPTPGPKQVRRVECRGPGRAGFTRRLMSAKFMQRSMHWSPWYTGQICESRMMRTCSFRVPSFVFPSVRFVRFESIRDSARVPDRYAQGVPRRTLLEFPCPAGSATERTSRPSRPSVPVHFSHDNARHDGGTHLH
jgi:hypothetical protein